MTDPIELAIESPDGTIDCRLERVTNDDDTAYSATILYPHIVNGYSRSDIYCHTMLRDVETNSYVFDEGEDIHPKIRKLEAQLSKAIINEQKR